MFKRTLIVVVAVLALGILLSACGGGELAKDLTPIPTLPQGEEPALVDALQGGGAAAATPEPSTGDGGAMDQAALVALGEDTFATECSGCHGAQDGAGPAFPGMAERAATEVDGMAAEDYLHESIVDPSAHVVEGFSDIMPKAYGTELTDQQIEGLVAYIMAESGGGVTGGEEPAEEPTEEPTEVPMEETTPEPTEEPTVEAPEETAQTGDPVRGEELFNQACSACHGAQDGAGPALPGMGEVAAERVESMTAEDYLHEAIFDPSVYVVEGYADIMPKTFGEQFDEEQINDMIAYILTQ